MNDNKISIIEMEDIVNTLERFARIHPTGMFGSKVSYDIAIFLLRSKNDMKTLKDGRDAILKKYEYAFVRDSDGKYAVKSDGRIQISNPEIEETIANETKRLYETEVQVPLFFKKKELESAYNDISANEWVSLLPVIDI